MLQERGQQGVQSERSAQAAPVRTAKFGDILNEPDIAERFEKVRAYFFLRESTYDMTNRCNIRCDGCYYYEGDKQFSRDEASEDAWRALMRWMRLAKYSLPVPLSPSISTLVVSPRATCSAMA